MFRYFYETLLNWNLLTDLGSPEGVAIDHLSRTVFWTDSVKDRIEVASLDGSQRRVLVDSELVNPRAIITDPSNGCVFKEPPSGLGRVPRLHLVPLQSDQAVN